MRAPDSTRLIDREVHAYCGEKKNWLIIDEDAEGGEKYGEDPFNRPLQKRLSLGVINIDKPPGPTSHEVVAWIKRMLGVPRAGHGGTLEPEGAFASPGGETPRLPECFL